MVEQTIDRRAMVSGTIGVTIAGLTQSGCSLWAGARLRYQIANTFETPEGTKTAMGVQEIISRESSTAMAPIDSGARRVSGDALVMTLDDKHYFIGLDQSTGLVEDTLAVGNVDPQSAKLVGSLQERLKAFRNNRGTAELSGEKFLSIGGESADFRRTIPFLSFDDGGDPLTMRIIELDELPGVTLKIIRIAVTSEPISRQAHDVLPWLSTLSADQVRTSRRTGQREGRLQGMYLGNLSDKVSRS